MPAHWTEETALKGRGHRSLGRRWRRVSARSVIGRGPSRDGTGAVIGRWDPAAAARNPRKVSASCMGRRRRRVDRGAAVGALPEAIAALSRTLPAGPSPEIFRRAKFDRPEAAPALWQLLFRVLSPLSANGASAPAAQEAQVRVVKSELHSQGYPRRALAQLPEDGSQGSRELLLALAWLLARGPLLERLLAQTRVRLGDEIPLCECEALARPGPPVPRVEADGPVDIRHLQWLMGKLRFQWRKLITSQQEQCALLGKIHSYTRGCHSDRSLGHLSVAETELLRDAEGGQQVSGGVAGRSPDRCTQRARTLGMGPRSFWSDLWLLCEWPGVLRSSWTVSVLDPGRSSACGLDAPPRSLLRSLESENVRLEAALHWRRQELVFWLWMDTVLGTCPPEASQPTFVPRIPERGAGEWELVARELQALREELRGAAEPRRAAWEARVGGWGPEWSAVQRASREAVGLELAALQRAWERGGAAAQPHGPCRLVKSDAGASGGPGLRAAQVIEVLRSREACLEAVLCQLQRQCRQELARLVGALPGLIWILPPGR
ncbi:tubulin epsilon and delta complex protein 1 isoform X6 [Herpailurus yagouaroundi]|uniref:tubulin epsilon and delta complex protein 1 isoform X6 n=1 Tax=Herpailurus yagouaroundi TaxID=1608482 RepID=UPI001AD74C3C|nr:tubulin epsilon and delta complex protein 1 isoform X6 [Puma yagouaroundi]